MGQPTAVKRAHERHCEEGQTAVREIETYQAREQGNSMVSTLSPAVLSLLGIEHGDELAQYVDTENGVIIIEVDDDE